MNVVVKERICRQCGRTFLGGPRAWYCPDCRRERQLDSQRRSSRRQRAGTTRKIGSIEICPICGKEMVIRSANQKYCPDCSPAMIRTIDSQQGRAWCKAARSTDEGRDHINAQKRAAHKRRTQVMRICPVCGKKFKTEHGNQRLCSNECKRKSQRYHEYLSEWRHGRRVHKPDPLPFAQDGAD